MADQESLSVSTPNAKAEMAEDQESLSVSTPNAKAEMAEDQESLSVSTPNAKAEMADQESASTPNAKTVADLFLAQYYEILRNYPDSLHKFYKDGSALKWPGAEFVTTIKGIEETIMASEYKGCEVKIINADAQDSLMEGIVLTVIGCLLGKDNVKKIMLQTFFLAKQGTFGFYVLNDNLCVMNTQEVLNISIASDDVDKSVSVASDVSSAQESGPADVHAEPKIDVPAEPKSVKGSTSTESTDVVEETPDGTVPAAEVPKPVTLTKNVTPANVSDDEKLEGQKLERQKISYASVLAKERKGSSFADNQGHKIVRVAPSSNQQSDVSPKIARVAPSFNQQQSRHFNRANIVRGTKERSFTENNSNIQNNSNNIRSEDSMARSVYMENLPKDITKDELAEAVKVFGLARPSDIQIKTFPRDGFCYGFVEFESEDSAKSAVEARKLTVKGSEARISVKKSGTRGAGGGFRSRNFKGQEKGEIRSDGSYRDDNSGRGYDRQSREFGERNSGSRDGRGYGGEAYPRNNGRNGGQLSNGGPQKDEQVQNGGGGNSNGAKTAAKS